jgi:hypothetical protein
MLRSFSVFAAIMIIMFTVLTSACFAAEKGSLSSRVSFNAEPLENPIIVLYKGSGCCSTRPYTQCYVYFLAPREKCAINAFSQPRISKLCYCDVNNSSCEILPIELQPWEYPELLNEKQGRCGWLASQNQPGVWLCEDLGGNNMPKCI